MSADTLSHPRAGPARDAAIAGAEGFSERLHQSLAPLGLSVRPAVFARWFNARSGGRPVTVHAVRKWLLGEACPAQVRLMNLSRLLGVDPTWLRFGTESTPSCTLPALSAPANEKALVDLYLKLPECDRQLLLQLARGLLEARRSAGRELEPY